MAPTLRSVPQLPGAARTVAMALSARMAEIYSPYEDEPLGPFSFWGANMLPVISDGVLNRLDRAAVTRLVLECEFHEVHPDFPELVNRVVCGPQGGQGKRIREVAGEGVLWLDAAGRVRFFDRLLLDEDDCWRINRSLSLLAALGWQASRAHLHPSKAPSHYQPLLSEDVRLRALALLHHHDTGNVVKRACPDLSGSERAQLYRALQRAADDITKDSGIQPDDTRRGYGVRRVGGDGPRQWSSSRN